MVSFKLKLVGSFVLLMLLPLGAAFWGFDSLVQRSETRRADARLETELRAGLNAYQTQVATLGRTATSLARNADLQRALRDHDRAALRTYAAAVPNLRLRAQGSPSVGQTPANAVVRSVNVVADGQVLGVVSLALPLDARLADRIAGASGLEHGDRLVLARSGRIVSGGPDLRGETVPTRAGSAGAATVGGTRYRVLAAKELHEAPDSVLAVLTPQRAIDAAARRSERTLVLAMLGMLALVGLVAYGLSRSIVGSLRRLARGAEGIAAGRLQERVPVRGRDEFGQLARAFNDMATQLEARMVELDSERVRRNRATSRIGEALAATHDADQLLAILCDAAVEATGAHGGLVFANDGTELVRCGDPQPGVETMRLPLKASRRSFGTLVLAGGDFGSDEREAASSLVAQASIALDNARLHRIVEQQALIDGLTGLANRRACEDRLAEELQRAERLGNELALVMADLDNFKEVNDRYGHSVGDVVLREFAQRLRETVREIDVAARWGGEEFCLLLLGTDTLGAARVAERARAALQDVPITTDGLSLRVTASFGVAAFPEQGDEAALLKAADGALYRAKRAGKNRVVTAAEPVAP